MRKCIFYGLFLLFQVASGYGQVTFIIQQIPANTPINDTLYIAGSFNNWNAGSMAHKLANMGNGAFAITLPTSGAIQYKYTRGNWQTVEGNANGGFRPNRNKTVVAGDTIRDTVLSWEDLGGSNSTAQPNVSRITGFFMPQFNRNKAVLIYLPLDYHSTQKKYPVLYMHDGQNVFDAATSFVGEWEVDETLNRLQNDSADFGCIVVAIESGAERIDELTPFTHPQHGGGEGDKYIQFIIQNLKPWVDSTYRTLSTPDFTAIGGSSLGGLISIYAHQKYPQTFGKTLVFSPSYWFNDSVYLLPKTNTHIADGRIFQLAGGQESNGSVVAAINKMSDSLLVNGILPINLKNVAKADGQHSEWFWRREFGAAYRWLFRATTFAVEEIKLSGNAGFPNPVGDFFTIQSCKNCTVLVFDTTGRLIADFTEILQSEPATADGWQTLYGLNQLLKPGIYYLKVYNQNNQAIYSLLKQ